MKSAPKSSPQVTVLSTRPEIKLLLCCARTAIDVETAERIKHLLRENLNWDYLCETASRHGVMPLLYQSLNTTCPEAVPETILSQLRDDFHANAQRNLFLTGELLKLLKLFEANDIPAIPLKGPILAASTYGNLALRQCGDLDILVQKQDVLRVKDLLVSQGYEPWSFSNAQEIAHLESETEHMFVRSDKKVSVDLHWELMRRYASFPLYFDHLWKYQEHVTLAGTSVSNLSVEDLLLFLCAHGTKHCWESLGWICDIAEMVRAHQKLNWIKLTQQAHMLGSERMLFLGLLLANDCLGIALPAEIKKRIQTDLAVRSLADQVQRRLFFHEASAPSTIFENSLFYIRSRERLRDQARYCLAAATPNARDLQFLPLPSFFSFLYYLIRPIRLIQKNK